MYSEVAGSTIVGNRVTDLLQEVKYKREGRGTIYFESLHIQCMPLGKEFIEIIQTQLAETDGEGNAIVTLHFKKHKKEKKVTSQQSWLGNEEDDGNNENKEEDNPPKGVRVLERR